jgi:hypothetical protein
MAFKTKLTKEQVAEIISKREQGMAYEKIGQEYGVSGSRVYELTHPEKQAEKAAALKAKHAAERAEKKASKKASKSEGLTEEEAADLDLDDVDADDDGDEGEAELV